MSEVKFLSLDELEKALLVPGLQILRMHRGPGKTERQLEEFADILWNEWEPVYNIKPKNTYKPHSFQPAKGEAPTSCKPNPKTVAKNRAKNKAAKAARKKS